MTDGPSEQEGGGLTSRAVPAIGPADHVTGAGPELIVYLDLACHHCAAGWAPLRSARGLRLCLRHFPVASVRPRAPALHAAAEAAGRQGAFFEFVDSLFADHGRLDDPHLWDRAGRLGLDVARFDRDRRAEEVRRRVESDFRSGIRAGVAGVPAAFAGGRRLDGPLAEIASRAALKGGGGGPGPSR